MPWCSNAKGKLPILAAPWRCPEWGTAAKTFMEKFRLPMHPNICGQLDYKSKSKLSKIYISFYSTVLLMGYVEKVKILLLPLFYLLSIWQWQTQRKVSSLSPTLGDRLYHKAWEWREGSASLSDEGGGQAHKPSEKSDTSCRPLTYASPDSLSCDNYCTLISFDYMQCKFMSKRSKHL